MNKEGNFPRARGKHWPVSIFLVQGRSLGYFEQVLLLIVSEESRLLTFSGLALDSLGSGVGEYGCRALDLVIVVPFFFW